MTIKINKNIRERNLQCLFYDRDKIIRAKARIICSDEKLSFVITIHVSETRKKKKKNKITRIAWVSQIVYCNKLSNKTNIINTKFIWRFFVGNSVVSIVSAADILREFSAPAKWGARWRRFRPVDGTVDNLSLSPSPPVHFINMNFIG